MADQFAKFNRGFFGGRLPQDAIFSGKKIIFRIGPTNRAAITLSTAGHADHYVQYVVAITNATSGLVDQMSFRFSDHLSKRTDHRPDHKVDFHVWSDGEWYIATPDPTEVAQMVGLILSYINLFINV